MNTDQLMNKIAEVAPDKFEFLTKAAAELEDSPFQDEVFEEMQSFIKRANPAEQAAGGFLNQLKGGAVKTLGGVGAAAAAGIAFSLAGDLYDAAKRGLTKSLHYKAMLRENPDLAEIPARDVQKVFSVLHRFNPDFASDPHVAGQFVRQQARLSSPFDTQQLSTLISARKNLGDAKRLPTITENMPNAYFGPKKKDGKEMAPGGGPAGPAGGSGGAPGGTGEGGPKWNPPSAHSGPPPNKPGESYRPTVRGGWAREPQQFHSAPGARGQRTKP